MESDDRSIIAGNDLARYFDLERAQMDFHSLFNLAGDANERAIVIIGASFIDTLLEHVLTSFFVRDAKAVRSLLRVDGPLGTYSSRTTTAYCLGLIGKIVRDDLRTVGRIRNKFAHSLDAAFDSDPVRKWCLALRWHEISMLRKAPEGATPREIFQVNVNQLIAHLHGIVSLARVDRREIRQE